jgi:hypothetical protein
MYALTTHWASRIDAARLAWIAGSATFTTEVSMNAMLEPTMVAASTQGFARSAQE